MAHKGHIPRCTKCDRDHYNFKPCESAKMPGIEWAQEEGWHDWTDQVHGGLGLPVQKEGWGCHGILPPEGKK